MADEPSRIYLPDPPPAGMPSEQAAWHNRQLIRVSTRTAALAAVQDDKLYTASALEVFSYAAYLGLAAPVDTATADLGAGWLDLDFLTVEATTPFRLTNDGLGRFGFLHEGAYFVSTSGSFEHNSSNSGRLTTLRLYNHTDGVPVGSGIVIGTGRNAEATALSAGVLAPIAAAGVGKSFGLQVGGGDVYTSVNFQALNLSVFNVGQWVGAVP